MNLRGQWVAGGRTAGMVSVNIAALVLRLAVGGTMMAHGWNHAFGGGKLPGTARWFESIGIRPGRAAPRCCWPPAGARTSVFPLPSKLLNQLKRLYDSEVVTVPAAGGA
jgi:DoxX